MTEQPREPLADVIYRWSRDTRTLQEASPEELEDARRRFVERMDLEIAGRRAHTDQVGAELRDTLALLHELRAKLGDDEGRSDPPGLVE
jgi:hypothetical protein